MSLFKRLFKRRNKCYSITKIGDISYSNPVDLLTEKIQLLDKEIQNTSRELLKSNLVRLRTIFSRNSSFLVGLQRRIVETSAEKSVLWYQQNLTNLYLERRILQAKLDRINGIFWIKRIYSFFTFSLLILSFFLLIIISLMGLFTLFHYLPFIFILVLIFYFINSSNTKFR